MSNATPVPADLNVVVELRRQQKVVDDLEGVLRQHQQLLRQKGMSLPQSFLPTLQKMRTDIEALGNSIDDAQTELQRLRALGENAELINSTLDLGDVLNAVM